MFAVGAEPSICAPTIKAGGILSRSCQYIVVFFGREATKGDIRGHRDVQVGCEVGSVVMSRLRSVLGVYARD